MSQNAEILAYLRAGNSLTPADAYSLFGTLALHSRIAELRRNHQIECEIIRTPSGKHVGRYSLKPKEELTV